MNTKKKNILLGIFVLSSLALFIIVLIALGGGSLFANKTQYTMYFDISVKGLSVGSPLMFRGVRIGQVTNIRLFPNELAGSKSTSAWPIEVTVTIDPATLDIGMDDSFSKSSLLDKTARDSMLMFKGPAMVDAWLTTMVTQHGFCATLQSLSFLTGQLYIEFNFRDDFNPDKQELADLENRIIPTRISTFERIFLSLSQKEQVDAFHEAVTIFTDFMKSGKARKTLDNMYEITENARSASRDAKVILADLRSTSGGVKLTFVGVLSQAFEALKNVNTLLTAINAEAPAILAGTRETVASLNSRIGILSEKAEVLLSDVQVLSRRLNTAADLKDGPFAEVLAELNDAIKQVNAAFAEMETLFKEAKGAIGPDSPERQAIQNSLSEVQRAARSIRSLADTLEQNPEAIIRGK